jgi:hypothetical protein
MMCELCGATLPVPEGYKVTLVPTCFSCGEGEMIHLQRRAKANFDFVPEPSEEQLESLIYSKSPIEDDFGMLPTIVSRLTPMLLLIKLFGSMKKNNEGCIESSELIGSFNRISSMYRLELRKVEDEFGVTRGLRLSDGFPKDTIESKRRFSNAVVGADSSQTNISEDTGLMQSMGLIRVIDDKVILTEIAEELIELNIFRSEVLEHSDYNPKGSKKVLLPRWMDKATVNAILIHISDFCRSEMLWMRDILARIAVSLKGCTFDEIIQHELNLEMDVPSQSRRFHYWKEDNGRGAADVIVEEAMDSGLTREESEDRAAEVLQARIKTSLSGTLGRMKEMSLIYPFKSRRQTRYKITEHGKSWYHDWTRETT